MSIPLSINGAVFEYPEDFDEDWGVAATGWAQAVTNGMLQRQGGNFPLTADANFGASFGLVSAYFDSRSANIATSGTLRLASADPGVAFRNNANSGNLVLTTDASDNLLYNGHIISATSVGPVTSITGTTNQIIASSPTGAITLSLPQNIATSSAVTFGSVEAPFIEAGNSSGVGFVALAGSGIALQAASGGGAVTVKGASSSGSSYNLLMPAAQGSSGTFLQNDGSGNLSWNTLSGSGTVNSGTTPNIAYYATSSNIISDSGISRANLFLADGTVNAAGAFNLNSHKITSLMNGSSAQDAVAVAQLSTGNAITAGGITAATITTTQVASNTLTGSTANSGGSAGNVAQGTISTPDMRTNAITKTASSGGSAGRTTGTNITSVSITTLGGPVVILANVALGVTVSGGNITVEVDVVRGSTNISGAQSFASVNTSATCVLAYPIMAIDTPTAGTYTYNLIYTVVQGTFSVIDFYSLQAIELRA